MEKDIFVTVDESEGLHVKGVSLSSGGHYDEARGALRKALGFNLYESRFGDNNNDNNLNEFCKSLDSNDLKEMLKDGMTLQNIHIATDYIINEVRATVKTGSTDNLKKLYLCMIELSETLGFYIAMRGAHVKENEEALLNDRLGSIYSFVGRIATAAYVTCGSETFKNEGYCVSEYFEQATKALEKGNNVYLKVSNVVNSARSMRIFNNSMNEVLSEYLKAVDVLFENAMYDPKNILPALRTLLSHASTVLGSYNQVEESVLKRP